MAPALELEALAKAGMRGIGEEYDDLIQLACEKTKLSEKQVKVCTAVCIGHCCSVQVQKWYLTDQPVSTMLLLKFVLPLSSCSRTKHRLLPLFSLLQHQSIR